MKPNIFSKVQFKYTYSFFNGHSHITFSSRLSFAYKVYCGLLGYAPSRVLSNFLQFVINLLDAVFSAWRLICLLINLIN